MAILSKTILGSELNAVLLNQAFAGLRSFRNDWMVFYRDRRLGALLKQISQKKGASANELLNLGRQVQELYVTSYVEILEN